MKALYKYEEVGEDLVVKICQKLTNFGKALESYSSLFYTPFKPKRTIHQLSKALKLNKHFTKHFKFLQLKLIIFKFILNCKTKSFIHMLTNINNFNN